MVSWLHDNQTQSLLCCRRCQGRWCGWPSSSSAWSTTSQRSTAPLSVTSALAWGTGRPSRPPTRPSWARGARPLLPWCVPAGWPSPRLLPDPAHLAQRATSALAGSWPSVRPWPPAALQIGPAILGIPTLDTCPQAGVRGSVWVCDSGAGWRQLAGRQAQLWQVEGG